MTAATGSPTWRTRPMESGKCLRPASVFAPPPPSALGPRADLLHVGAQILSRHHAHDAGTLERGLCIDLAHARVRVRAPHERDIVQSGHRDVADVRGGAGHEPGIFLALHFRAHQPGVAVAMWILSWVSGSEDNSCYNLAP